MVSLEEAKQQLDILELQMEGIKTSYHDVRMVEMSIIRIGNSLVKLTGSPEVEAAINKLNRLIGVMRSVQIMIHAFEIASGPIGWLYLGATVLTTGIIFGETVLEMTS